MILNVSCPLKSSFQIRFLLLHRFNCFIWIARGSRGSIFQTYDTHTEETFAIKRVKKDISNPEDQGIAVTLLREAAVLRTLQHPNIVQLQNVIVTSSSIYLVLELCACNLRHHLQELQAAGQATMDVDQLKRIASHIFSALAYCHEHHVMHRSSWEQEFSSLDSEL